MHDDSPTLDSRQPSFDSGRTIAKRYHIEALLGVGAFGRVYRARDEMLGRPVALKTMIFGHGIEDEKEAVTHFLEEARTIAKLDHPNIVPVHDAGIEEGTPWMAMRLVDGESLDAAIKKHGQLDPRRAIDILIQAAKALDHAHRKGIVHRDIKPSNILLEKRDDGSDHLWLADFGIARILSGRTAVSEAGLVGTPAYMSPEQITGKKVDARADIFALGCVACELITGKRAFQGDSYSQIMYRLVHDAPEGFAEIGDKAGKPVEAIIKRALSKSPEDRYQTAEELGHALEAVAKVNGTAHHRGGGMPLAAWLRRKAPQPWDGRNVLVISDLVKGYGFRKKVLNGVNLTIPTGTIYALLGRNGSGKTTLIHTFLGLYRKDSGSVSVFGRSPYDDGPAILARTGYVPETIAVFDWINVGELIQFLRGVYQSWDNGYCYELLKRFELPLDIKIRDLSKGMKTKVSVVAALSHRPEFLVLDDPTLGLDQVVLREVFETLQEAS
ncbi:MAG TPA: protein kinase, partial [Terriglobia bacterium]|nr:protein kinase [Terriglobia bacterium]